MRRRAPRAPRPSRRSPSRATTTPPAARARTWRRARSSAASAATGAACPADENLSDTSPKDSEASGADDSNSGGATITGDTGTSGKPGTTADEITSSPGETGAVDTTTSGDTTGKPGTSTSEDTTVTPEISTSSDTTEGPGTTGPGTTGDTSSGGDTTTGAPVGSCPDGWTRARTISITNEPKKPLTNFQVGIKVLWDDDMNADFSDLRFTDAMGAPLSYWVEEYTAPIEALVWVKVPAITAADVTTIEMCYGNPEAKSAADGVATFHFFDGFDGFDDNTLDPNKWETTAPVEFALGVLKVIKGAVYTKTNPGSFPNLLIEARTRMVPSVNGQLPYMRISSAQIEADPVMGIGPGSFHFGQYMQTQFFGGDLKTDQGCCDAGTFTVYGLGLDEGNTYAIAKRKFSATAKVSWKKPFFIGLGGQMKSAGDMEIHDMWVDWVLVRKFTSIEPTTAVGPEKNL